MELFDSESGIEASLIQKALDKRLPIGGSMELLPLCNMNCSMCYIRLTKQQMKTQGRMLSCDEWLKIAESAKEAGVLSFLLTGGEPLLYPEFEKLYDGLTRMGFLLTMNTNGTLIDEKIADMFAAKPIRRLNITLYGTDNETYAKLCGNPHGFSQIENALKLLKERKIHHGLNFSITPQNVHQLHDAYQFAAQYGLRMDSVGYMFPPVRKKGMNAEKFSRLSAKEAAAVRIQELKELNPGMDIRLLALHLLKKVGKANPEKMAALEGPNCKAGRCGFWINWKGELLPCGMFSEPMISLLDHSFKEGWSYITERTKQIKRCKKCDECPYIELCPSCSASCLAETGNMDECPEYLCEYTHELIRLVREILQNVQIRI